MFQVPSTAAVNDSKWSYIHVKDFREMDRSVTNPVDDNSDSGYEYVPMSPANEERS